MIFLTERSECPMAKHTNQRILTRIFCLILTVLVFSVLALPALAQMQEGENSIKMTDDNGNIVRRADIVDIAPEDQLTNSTPIVSAIPDTSYQSEFIGTKYDNLPVLVLGGLGVFLVIFGTAILAFRNITAGKDENGYDL